MGGNRQCSFYCSYESFLNAVSRIPCRNYLQKGFKGTWSVSAVAVNERDSSLSITSILLSDVQVPWFAKSGYFINVELVGITE